jgi:predicted metalloendopeptidase
MHTWTSHRAAIAIAFMLGGLPYSCVVAQILPAPSVTAAPALIPPTPKSPVKPGPRVVLPGDDFFTHANSDWLAQTEIPADRSSWSAFSALGDLTNNRIVALIDAVAADKQATGDARKVADYYAAFMDEAGIEAKGVAPLWPVLSRISAISDKTSLARALGASLRADVDPLNNTDFEADSLFGLWVAQGLSEPERNLPYLLQGGLGLPDRAYYVTQSAPMADMRKRYTQHIAAMLKLAGFANSAARAERVMALETSIAQAHASRADSADIVKANNSWKVVDFAARAPGMDWPAFFTGAMLDQASTFMVWHPGAVSGAAALVASVDTATWKDYLAFHQINQHAGALPKAFGAQHFAFYGVALAGTPQQAPRFRRALAATDEAMGEAVGRLYVERYFPPENKVRLKQMVNNIIAAFSRRIDKLEWMAPATRAQAQEKLKSMYVGIGYPDRWTSYEGLKVLPGDAFGNAQRAGEFHYAQQVAKLGQPVDHGAWAMSPQEVNAVNLPLQNAMNFPAAILQPPFFDPAASDAVNYGAIGSTIGHEISHGFDDQGAQFDAQGRLRDWWTKEDLAHFKLAADRMVAQFDAYRPFPDLAVNGRLTLSENLADLAGLEAAYDAFRTSLTDKPVPPLADQKFFIGYANSSQSKVREASFRQRLLTDSHAPDMYRTAIVRNMDAWYTAFDVKPGQALYLAPADRVRVW